MKINFKITTKCPADCLCCEERLSNFKENCPEMVCNDKLIDCILQLFDDRNDKNNHLSITGGEPTLVAKLPQYVQKFTDKGITVGVDTNGWLLNKKWLKEMEDAGLKYILISVYSLDEKNFNLLRSSKDGKLYKKVIHALQILKDYKKNGGKIEIRLQCVLLKQNYREIPDLLELAIKSDFEAFSTSYYISQKANGDILMSKNDIDNFQRDIEPKMKKVIKNSNLEENLKIESLNKISSFFLFPHSSLEQAERGIYRSEGVSCNEKEKLVIYPNGNIVPCLGFDYYMQKKYCLNIYEDGNIEKINNGEFEQFWKDNNKMCLRCASGYQVWFRIK